MASVSRNEENGACFGTRVRERIYCSNTVQLVKYKYRLKTTSLKLSNKTSTNGQTKIHELRVSKGMRVKY